MGNRGRKSSAELAAGGLAIVEARRPPPPASLSDVERLIWRDAVGCMPPGFFGRAQYPVLQAFCRHAARADVLAALVTSFKPEWVNDDGGLAQLDKLMAMAERETRAITACARALRLTIQAQETNRSAAAAANSAARAAAATKLWDFR